MKTGDKTYNNEATFYIIGDKEIPQTGKLVQVGPNGQFVRLTTMKATGQKIAIINNHGYPVELLGLAAGKDAWMRGIVVRCSDCKDRFPVGTMECGMCQACYDKASEENAIMDGAVA